jgi:undecaprenyl phosphate-alpha-L-ara4N flippase subunit ArnE
MTFLAVSLCLLCQICLVGGQLFLKHAMNAAEAGEKHWAVTASGFGGGVLLLSLWFFLWLGLLRDWELTRLFPFEALSPLLLALGAWGFLNERISARAWVGVVLIGVGVLLVAAG